MPRVLSICLVVNGFTYLVVSVVGLLMPSAEEQVSNFIFLAFMGELAVAFWLVVKGPRDV